MRHVCLLAGLLLPVSSTMAQKADSGVRFPLQVRANERHLVDQAGRPFLVVGDTPWSLIADLNEADIKKYLDNRQKRGFNALIVNLIENKFSTNAPRNRAGIAPFLKPGDFSTPNPRYFDFAHRVIGWANERGIAVWLCPAYLGWNGGDEGFFAQIKAGGPERLQAYGRFVGERFKDLPNVVWMVGGDYAVPKEHHWTITDLAAALRAAGAKQLMTVHGGQQSAVDVVGEQDWIAVNNTYSYQEELFRVYRKDYQRQPVRPFVLIESTYENEHRATPDKIRRQAYWAMTCGACGQFFGNNPIWHFDGPGLQKPPRGWREELDGTGSREMTHLRAAFAPLAWHRLVPDLEQTLVVKGVGTSTGTITAASTANGDLAVVYIPSTGREARAFNLDLSRLAAPVTARWFNPTTGQSQAVGQQVLVNRGTHTLRTPGDNGTKTNDWLLILQTKP